jgi:CDP-glycerol glycerophosphotransferase (TagB/SpsB family)
LFCPTFREAIEGFLGSFKRKESNITVKNLLKKYFAYDSNKFFCERNILLLIKLHPYEESCFNREFTSLQNIKLISTTDLVKTGLSLRQILPHIDLLITDYCSIYVDYLLLKKPILFITDDYESYKSHRGFILDSYEELAPGPKVNSFTDFLREFERLITDDSYYCYEREKTQKLLIEDIRNSCERIWEEIIKL